MAEFDVALWTEQDAITAEHLVAFWVAEGVLEQAEAERRVREIVAIATGADGELVGVSTAYLTRQPQLGMTLWYVRGYVSPNARIAALAETLAHRAHAELERRWTQLEDRRGAGILWELENRELARRIPLAMLPRVELFFLGLSARGLRLYARYFPGAAAPEPPPSS